MLFLGISCMKLWSYPSLVPSTAKLQSRMQSSVPLGSSVKPTFGESVSSAVTQNQLVVLFGITWLIGLLVVTIFLTQFT